MSGLKLVNSEESGDFRLKELNKHLDTFPLSRTLANKYYAQEIVIKLGIIMNLFLKIDCEIGQLYSLLFQFHEIFVYYRYQISKFKLFMC